MFVQIGGNVKPFERKYVLKHGTTGNSPGIEAWFANAHQLIDEHMSALLAELRRLEPVMPEPTNPPAVDTILVSAREAAKLLSISQRTLWTLTKNGDIPSVRLGRAVRYSVAELRKLADRR